MNAPSPKTVKHPQARCPLGGSFSPIPKALDNHGHFRRAGLAFTNRLHYSYRNACVGAIRDARRAGT
jgi:hypothetical protein